ncbi:hypothetical protein PRIPAC_77668 [Pristionchus pacificus]|uniref:Uncharacterized protein n=1 Tax=Pristionchus pacificus TaxID=54126 RepID=A0A2A6CKB4_PRIPA|nr:hypothetical protein PRIPAC_77668 [Pristionchus pacificus]|eukprot:PDM78471.1 hypothetical protein PRIPAC_31050 [Pristionchus pacificus]
MHRILIVFLLFVLIHMVHARFIYGFSRVLKNEVESRPDVCKSQGSETYIAKIEDLSAHAHMNAIDKIKGEDDTTEDDSGIQEKDIDLVTTQANVK